MFLQTLSHNITVDFGGVGEYGTLDTVFNRSIVNAHTGYEQLNWSLHYQVMVVGLYMILGV